MWVLIVLVIHTGGFAAMTSAAFHDQKTCEAAAAQWRKDFTTRGDTGYGVKALCHPTS